MSVLFFAFVASPGIAVRPERAHKADTAASVSGRVAALADLAKAAATQTSDPAAGLTSAQSLVEGLTKDGNATEHMSSENLAVLNEVIKIINSTIYASMDADHRSDKKSLADAVDAMSSCHETLTDRQSPSGDIGGLEEDAFASQLEQNRLSDDLDKKKAENETAWNALVAHMGGLQAGQCTSLPNKRTTTNLDSYYADNSATDQFIAQYIAQKKVYEEKRDAQMTSKTALEKAQTQFDSNRQLLRSQFCDWKRVLVSACSGYDTCYASKSKLLSDLIERVAANKKSRMDVFRAGENIVAHIKFLIGKGQKIEAVDVDAKRYELEMPKVPEKETCDVSGLTDSRWKPAIDCSAWVLLAEGVSYTGKRVSEATAPQHTGEFKAFKAVYRGGSGIQCNRRYHSDYKWQTCHRVKRGAGAWSFELKKNSNFVVEQPNWNTLPKQCKVPDTPTGDIVCDVNFKLASGDTITAGWYEPFRQWSTGDNGGSITIDIFGKAA